MQNKLLTALIALLPSALPAQSIDPPAIESAWTSPGIIGTLLLVALILTLAIIILSARVAACLTPLKKKQL
ncbi:MAG TPA: hypothetical protein VF490_21295, partial [Chryseosolibacter sp.]